MNVAAEWERTHYRVSHTHPRLPEGPAEPDLNLSILIQVSRCISIVEVFTFDRIRTRIEEYVKRNNLPILDATYKANKKSIDSSWNNIQNAAKDWLRIDFSLIEGFELIEGYIEVRNSTMHANGFISPRQEKNLVQVQKKIARTGIALAGRRLAPETNSVRICATRCRDFIAAFDVQTSGFQE